MSDDLLRLVNIKKSFPSPDGKGELRILEGVDLVLKRGEVIAIIGQSGSGKSTLLSAAALLTDISEGEILYSGENVENMNEREISNLRSKKMGFVFQSSLLLEDFSALENIAMPLMIQGMKRIEALSVASEYLALVSLSDRANHRPKTLSGGERQRVAIARALASSPDIIFADEPTGSLDEKNAEIVEDMLLSTVREKNKGMLLVTHNPAFAAKADKIYTLKGGKLE